MIQPTTAPPVWSPWVLTSAMRDPSEVVYQDSAFGSVLSVPLSLAIGGVMPLTASSRALLSSSRQAATLILATVPVPSPVKAASHAGPRAASHALSWLRIAARPDASALAYLADCAALISASTFSVLVSKHFSMTSVLPWPQLAGAVSTRAGWPGSKGSTMLTNGATAAVVAVAVDAGLDVPVPAPPDDPGDPVELQPVSIPASPAPHNASTATCASGRLAAPSRIANSINPLSQQQHYSH